jgi:hypothetical protein
MFTALLVIGVQSAAAGAVQARRFDLAVRATEPACWSGAVRLRVSATRVHPGEVVTLSTSGTNPLLLIGGVGSDLEAEVGGNWKIIGVLTTSVPAGTTKYGFYRPTAPLFAVGFTKPVQVRIPEVSPGGYRISRSFTPIGHEGSIVARNFPNPGATLCREIQVLSTKPDLIASTDVSVAVQPQSGLRSGQRVRVALSHFGSRGFVSLSQCAFFSEIAADGCGTRLSAQSRIKLNKSGSATTLFVVYDKAPASSGRHPPLFSCATNCVVVATLGSGYAYAAARIDFAVSGAVTGSFDLVGGPFPGLDEPIPGVIRFQTNTGTTYTTSPAADGEYSILVPPGRYRVTARSPKFGITGPKGTIKWPCSGSPPSIVVKPGETVNEPIFCEAA